MQRCSLHLELWRIRESAPMDLFALVDDADEEEAIRSKFMTDLRAVESMRHDELEALAGNIAYWTKRVDAAAMSRAKANYVDWANESHKEHYKGPLRYINKRAIWSDPAIFSVGWY